MAKHTVKFGEHLARIAYEAGFTDFRHIFDHGDNTALKSKRKSPHVLVPGDTVVLPEPEPKVDESAATEKRHTYEVEWRKLKVRFVLHDPSDKPVKSQACLLEVDGWPVEIKTDGAGTIEREVPHDAANGSLRARNPASGFEVDAVLLIGGLQPVETVPGQIARLNNLGYFAGDPEAPPGAPPKPQEKPDPEVALRFRSAVEEFQCDHGLAVDGKCGPGTQGKLKELHGC